MIARALSVIAAGVIALGLFGASPVAAQGLITAQAYWVDAGGQADLAQARAQTYTPYRGVLGLGYVASPTWVRLHIEPRHGLPQDSRIVLRIQPQYLDDIALYDPVAAPGTVQHTGDRTDYATQSYSSIAHGFLLLKGDAPRDVWLRLQTTSTSLLEIDAFGESQIRDQEQTLYLVVYGVMTLLTAFVLLGLASWIQDREWLQAIFLLRAVVYFCLIFCFFGLARAFLYRWIPVVWFDVGFNVLLIFSTILAIHFEIALLSEWGMKPWGRYILTGLLLASCLNLLLLWSGHAQQAMFFNTSIACVVALLTWTISFFGLQDGTSESGWFALHKNYLRAYYSVILLIVFLGLPLILGLGGSSMTVFVSYGVFSGISLTCLMQYRARQLRHHLETMRVSMALLQQKSHFEEARHEEQKRLMALLMHEIKNPLAVIDAARNTSHADNQALVGKNVAIIRHVLERSFKLEQFNDGYLKIEKSDFLLSDCLTTVIDETDIDESRLDIANLDDARVIHTDEAYLRTILGNLLGNAFKYSALNSPIVLTVLQDPMRPQHLGVCISNQPGVSGWPDPQRVFEKYYRSEVARLLPGTGMGLYLVRKLVEALEGECRYAPDPQSVRFELWLPV